MPTDCISYQNSGYFTPLMVDYLNQRDNLKPLYHHFPTIDNFKQQIAEKQQNFPHTHRDVLVSVLQKQYKDVAASADTLANIKLLGEPKTFTVTTGHQLNLFTGPLYFLYKIVSAVKLAKELKAHYPAYDFVPVYWMATEDHDFEEINYFNFRDKKVRWNRETAGPVGRLSTDGLKAVLDVFAKTLGPGINAKWLTDLFENAYLKHQNLADATRFLANEIFKDHGLVIIDADTPELKTLFAPYIKEELLQQTSHRKVAETAALLKDYNVQVNPRDINLFYIENDLRERIILQDGIYYINNTQLKFSQSELLAELENHPEKFSPNVIMRPLYQEVILPNLTYIGGGGELAYWLELKSFFDSQNITFPMLLMRNGALLATAKQAEKLDKLNLTWADVFSKQQALLNKKVQEFSEFKLDFSKLKATLSNQFTLMNDMASKTDSTFIGAVKAQELKQLKGLENLEKRLLKAEKRNHADQLERIVAIQNELFPNGGLQERRNNFSEFYLEYDGRLLTELFAQLKPLEQEFNIIVL